MMIWQREVMRDQRRRKYRKRQYRISAVIISLICTILLSSCGPEPGSSSSYHAEGIENYNKDVIIEKYGGDLDSDLSLFPMRSSLTRQSIQLISIRISLILAVYS